MAVQAGESSKAIRPFELNEGERMMADSVHLDHETLAMSLETERAMFVSARHVASIRDESSVMAAIVSDINGCQQYGSSGLTARLKP